MAGTNKQQHLREAPISLSILHITLLNKLNKLDVEIRPSLMKIMENVIMYFTRHSLLQSSLSVFSHVFIVAIDHDRCTALQSAVPMTPSLQHSLVHYHSALPGSSYQHRVAPLLATGYYTVSTLAPGWCTAGHCGSVGCQSSSWSELQVTPYQCNGYR